MKTGTEWQRHRGTKLINLHLTNNQNISMMFPGKSGSGDNIVHKRKYKHSDADITVHVKKGNIQLA